MDPASCLLGGALSSTCSVAGVHSPCCGELTSVPSCRECHINMQEGGGIQAVCCLQDPYPKPCYLFSVVAGDLALREATHRTHTGRDIRLQIYVPAAYIEQVSVAP